ncbi:DUF397 domain-containing protein [Streptomyces sp. NPDC094468]|uniref:DUF397 domain-containing protein n=1 Tax=Streptomyces sp. NPDC094468 TaxID=3366066 RepID=UPI00382DD7D3
MIIPPPSSMQIAAATWTKSSYSASNNECVETAVFPSWTAVRDSKFTSGGPKLVVTSQAFTALLTGVADGSL